MLYQENRPTLAECRAWRDTLVGEWSSLSSEQEREEKIYFQQFDLLAPYGQFAAKTGSAPADADAAVDTLVPPEILVRVRPARAREKYREQADKLMRFARALIFSWRRNRDPIRKIVNDMVIRRYGVGRVMFDETLWPTAPAGMDEDSYIAWETKNRRRCPIVFQHRPARYVRWREHDGALLSVIEHYPSKVLEARAAFGRYPAAQRILRGRDPNDTVYVSDVWIGSYRCLLIEDEPVFPVGRGSDRGVVPHGYADIPYIIFPFRELPFDEMERRYRGMLTNASELYPLESQVVSMQVWMLAWNAWRTFVGWTKDGRDLRIMPGHMIPIDRRIGEYLEMLQGEPVPPELLQTAAVLDSYIQRNGVAQGPRTAEGTRSGQQLWAIQAMRQIKIESAKMELKSGMERALSLAAMIAETFLDDRLTLPVPGRDRQGNDMGEVTISPKDINGYWDGFEVSFGKRLDPALLEQAKALAALAANNWMPLRYSWEYSGLIDVPQEWEDELLLQAVERLDFIIEAAGLEKIKQFYGEDSDEYRMFRDRLMQQRRASQGMAGGPGIPSPGGIQPPSMRGAPGMGISGAPVPAPFGGRALPKSSRASGDVRGPRTPDGGAAPTPPVI